MPKDNTQESMVKVTKFGVKPPNLSKLSTKSKKYLMVVKMGIRILTETMFTRQKRVFYYVQVTGGYPVISITFPR